MNNIKLLEFCFKNKENYIDNYYVKNSDPIITNNPKKLNKLMKANSDILDNISAYKIAIESKNIEMQKTALENIIKALKTTGINNSEFSSYWALKDMSYSSYKSFSSTPFIQIEFLKSVIPEFIKNRHLLYKLHGYSFSSIQAIKDSKAHKGSGNLGNKKVSDIFNSFNFSHFTENNLDEFIKTDKVYIYPDKTEKKLFKEIIKYYNINFKWSKNHENKQTDFLFKINSKIFIMEHKHMKESGGGQDKQMSEIIDFISYNDNNVSYVSFLDGIYFNLLANKSIKLSKTQSQRESIYNNLKSNKQNYFVNTKGFVELLKFLKQ